MCILRLGRWEKGVVFGVLLAAASVSAGLARAQPAPAYELALAPLAVYGRLPGLRDRPVPRLSADERKSLERVWERNAKKPAPRENGLDELMLQAMLFASGVEDASARKKYHQQFDQLVGRARQAVQGAGADRDRADRLLRFLHKSVMNKGYAAEQTSFSAVFDTGTFNCVSSTAMYHLVGTRLGLKLEALSISGGPYLPGHASLDLIDGDKRIDVEPTNADGFDWQAKISRPGVIVLSFAPSRKNGRKVDVFGVASMICSNRAIVLSKAKPPRRMEAVRCYLSAPALDPANQTASGNLLAAFTNWGPELAGEKKFEEALRVLAFGLEVAPRSSALRNNYSVIWSRYIDALLESGQDKDALKVIARAAEAVPADRDFKGPAHWFIRLGEKRVREKGWETGLDEVECGLKVLPADEGKKVQACASTCSAAGRRLCCQSRTPTAR